MTLGSPDRPRLVTETPLPGLIPAVTHPEWRERWPWLQQGTTTRGAADDPFDLGWSGDAGGGGVQRRWSRLVEQLGMSTAVFSPQPHGSAVRVHDALPPGVHRSPACDGHGILAVGTLAAVTVADCVPVWVVDPGRRAVAVLHAGWRGVAAGVLERGIAVAGERFGSKPGELFLHFGPSICGDCYEVGPEVHAALGEEEPDAPRPVDLRALLARRAAAAGVPGGSVSASAHCTLHGDLFFSHRGGDSGRQVGFVGLRS